MLYIPSDAVVGEVPYLPVPDQSQWGLQNNWRTRILGKPTPDTLTITEVPELHKRSIAGFIVLPELGRRELTFHYELPTVADSIGDGLNRYQLLVQKQTGVYPLPNVIVELALPPGANLVNAQPTPTKIDGQWLTFDFLQTGDVELVVEYHLDTN